MEYQRRHLLGGVATLASGATALGLTSSANAATRTSVQKSGMNHRNWAGTLGVYLINDRTKREFARESYDVTTQPDGFRTIRQISEWGDVDFLKNEPSCDLGGELSSQTLKDVVLNVDGQLTAITAFVQFFSKQRFQGSAWYNFTDKGVECAGSSLQKGRFTDTFAYENVRPFFYFHSIYSDINWYLTKVLNDKSGKNAPQPSIPRLRFMATPSLLGNAGPVLVTPLPGPEGGRPYYDGSYIGEESITVGAGTFKAHHCRVTQAKTGQFLDYWVYGEDRIPIRCAAHGLHWDMVQLAGDYK